jgi:hypothetical protein
MQSLPSIEQMRQERPGLSDDQLIRQERRYRLRGYAAMMCSPWEIPDPPGCPDDPWPIEDELRAWLHRQQRSNP